MSEIWTAYEEVEEDGKQLIIFKVVDERTEQKREERRYKKALPLMLSLGGYSSQVGFSLINQELPWRFRKIENGQIYLDGPSIGVEGYHPIDNE